MNDLISRQAAIKAIENLQDCYNGFSDTYDKACIIGVIEEVPSIEPIKHGRWEKKGISIKGIEKEFCSECKTWSYGRNKAFCPNCGADMQEVEE